MAKAKKHFLHRDMTTTEKVISFIVVLLFTLFLYLASPLARLSKITIHTSQDVSREEILHSTKLVANEVFVMPVFFSDHMTEQVKKQYPKVDTMTYHLDASNALTVVVKEHQVIGTVTSDTMAQVVLSNGTLLERYYDKYIGSVVDITWQTDLDKLQAFAHEFAQVSETIQKQIASVSNTEKEPLMVRLYMKDGNTAIVHYTDFSKKLSYYDQLVQEVNGEKGTFDFSVGIFFKPYR